MKLEARELMAFTIVAMVGWVLYKDPFNAAFTETLKNAFVLAVGYYLGASKIGSDTAVKNAEIVSQAAMGEPQAVTVVNDEKSPVPVEAK